MELENIILSEMNQVQKAKSHISLSYVEYRPNTNTNNFTYACKYLQNMYPKVELVEETKGRGKER
jgi:hypothetical protein